MFSNYLKVALRNLLRHKGYSAINILGLAVGMAACIVILLIVRHELSFDRFHSKADRICRVYEKMTFPGWTGLTSSTQGPVGPALCEDFPEVSAYTRLQPADWQGNYLLHYRDRHAALGKAYYADPFFFQVFDFGLLAGDAETALKEPHTAVLTEETARKIFGAEHPVGKIFQNKDRTDYKVTGILKKMPANSHLQFDLLLSAAELEHQPGQVDNWQMFNFNTYVLLAEGADAGALSAKLPAFTRKYFADQAENYELHLQPLKQIHLHSAQISEFRTNWFKSDINYVRLISCLALLVILIACCNFVSLSTARSSGRAREIGTRKLVGARRGQLLQQFLGESLLQAGLALLIAVALIELFLPLLNRFFGGVLEFRYLTDWRLLAGLIGLVLVVGLLSGSYPALLLSSFRSSAVLKGSPHSAAGGVSLRKIMVVGQFATSMILLISTLIIIRQLRFMQGRDPGFDANQVLCLPFEAGASAVPYEVFRRNLLRSPLITGVTASSLSLGQREIFSKNGVAYAGDGSSQSFSTSWLAVDSSFISFFGLQVVEGRPFLPELGSSAESAGEYIINEALARKLDWKTIDGKRIGRPGAEPTAMQPVTGVVKDFNYMSLHSAVEPLVIFHDRGGWQLGQVSVRYRAENAGQVLDYIRTDWSACFPDRPFAYSFLDDDLASMYRPEEREAVMLSVFSALAVFIACLGLLGLVALAAERRTKEIGVRKVLGATVADILLLLSREFLLLLAAAMLIAWPVAWYVMDKWLANFAYRIELDWLTFLAGGLIALTVAALTVGYQALRAATTDPVKALHYE